MRIIYAIIIFMTSVAIIKYRERLQSITGPVSFAEKFLGSGGTFAFYALLGSFGVFLSIMVLFNVHSSIIAKIYQILF